LEIKEMPLEEKYDKLLDGYLLSVATNYALHKELRTVDKWLDYIVKVQKKMFPSWLGIALKVLKTITPGRVFKQVVDRGAYQQQIYHPLSSIEVTMVSDREMVGRIKNCVPLKRMKDLVRKAGLDLDPKFICEADSKIFPELFKEFGIDVTMELEENGCIFTAKLK
jgi:hypothetical protein